MDVPPSDDLRVNRKGTSLLTYQGFRRAPEFPHILTLALSRWRKRFWN